MTESMLRGSLYSGRFVNSHRPPHVQELAHLRRDQAQDLHHRQSVCAKSAVAPLPEPHQLSAEESVASGKRAEMQVSPLAIDHMACLPV
jgi:hypothetical protein